VTILSKREAGLVEEGKAQLLRAAHALHPSVESRGGLAKIRSAEIGELLAFDVSPQVFDGIEFRGIAGQPLDREPMVIDVNYSCRSATIILAGRSQVYLRS
jgi:hypothetical protein